VLLTEMIVDQLKILECTPEDFGKIARRIGIILFKKNIKGALDPAAEKKAIALLELMKQLQMDVNQHGAVLPINWRQHEKIVLVLLARKNAVCESICGEHRCNQQLGHKGKHSFVGETEDGSFCSHTWSTEGAAQFNRGRERLV